MTTYSKEKIGIIQLETAIRLFYEQHFIPALTLSVAAEEIFGAFLKLYSEGTGIPIPTAAKMDAGMFELFADFLGIKNYHVYRNEIKNELKHHGEPRNKDIISADFEQIARTHISGAIINYKFWQKKYPGGELVQKFCKTEGLSIN
jgi:hypothetical protein